VGEDGSGTTGNPGTGINRSHIGIEQTGSILRFMNGGDTGFPQRGNNIGINPIEISYSY
jgi:hypothetical protein